MTVLSLRDYAHLKGVSYEAIRKQVARYKAELDGHIIREGRQQFLDEEAVAFLDARRQKNPVILVQQSRDETIEALRAENKELLKQLAEAHKLVGEVRQQLLEAKGAQALLEAAESRADALQAEVDRYEPWAFGLWRKKR